MQEGCSFRSLLLLVFFVHDAVVLVDLTNESQKTIGLKIADVPDSSLSSCRMLVSLSKTKISNTGY